MSWHITFFARTKFAAIERVKREQVVNTHFPEAAAESIIALVNWLPSTPRVISVTSSGSAYGEGGSAAISVQLVDLLE